jgi:elongation factor P
MGMTDTFRNGQILRIDNVLYLVDEAQYVKPGKGNTIIRLRLKNVLTGAVLQRTYRSGEKLEEVAIEMFRMQYLYNDGEHYHVMNVENYEQIMLPKELMEDYQGFLKENAVLEVQFFEGQPIACNPPTFLELKIAHTEPGVKGDTVSNTTKAATLETGATVQVPLFINIGDTLKIDLRTRKYVERTRIG